MHFWHELYIFYDSVVLWLWCNSISLLLSINVVSYIQQTGSVLFDALAKIRSDSIVFPLKLSNADFLFGNNISNNSTHQPCVNVYWFIFYCPGLLISDGFNNYYCDSDFWPPPLYTVNADFLLPAAYSALLIYFDPLLVHPMTLLQLISKP